MVICNFLRFFVLNLVLSFSCCENKTGCRLTSTIDTNPFLLAICCFVADTTSWILVLHNFWTNTSYTLPNAFQLNKPMFGNRSSNVIRKVILRWSLSLTLSCAAYIHTKRIFSTCNVGRNDIPELSIIFLQSVSTHNFLNNLVQILYEREYTNPLSRYQRCWPWSCLLYW